MATGNLEGRPKRSRNKVTVMQAKLQSLQSRYRSAQEETRELRGAAASAQQRAAQMAEELEREASDRRGLQRELGGLQRELGGLQRELGGLREAHQVVKTLRDSQALELQAARAKLLAQGSSLERLQDALHAGEMQRRRIPDDLCRLPWSRRSTERPVLVAEQVMNLFAVNYSVRGSSRRSEEERAVGYWRDWLIDVEGGDAVLVVEDTENRVTLNQLLMFVTGADRVPPLGFPGEPTKLFAHCHGLPGSKHLCNDYIKLYIKLPLHNSFESFSDSMISGIIQSPCFGYA
ncbi:unnamed protein product [Boreogadus saida]